MNKSLDRPNVPELLKQNLVLIEKPEGIKMIYTRNKLFRKLFFLLSLFILLFAFFVSLSSPENAIGIILLGIFMIFCFSIPANSYIFKCSIVFTDRYILFQNLTMYPRKTIIRRFNSHYLEVRDWLKIVRNQNGEHRFPMVYLKSRYSMVEIHHSDMSFAKEHMILINECINYTR